jgi:hypothetical protein
LGEASMVEEHSCCSNQRETNGIVCFHDFVWFRFVGLTSPYVFWKPIPPNFFRPVRGCAAACKAPAAAGFESEQPASL